MATVSQDRAYQPAKQARSRRTEQKFFDAARSTFLKSGFSGARIADIILASGCSTGSFYHRFADKRDLFDVMLDQFCEYTINDIQTLDLSRATHGSIEALLRFYVNRSQETVQQNLGFYRAAYEISTQDPEVWTKLKQLTLHIGAEFTKVAPEYAEQIQVAEKQEALVHAIQLIITMSIHTALGSGPLFPRDVKGLSDVILRAALGVLTDSHPSP